MPLTAPNCTLSGLISAQRSLLPARSGHRR